MRKLICCKCGASAQTGALLRKIGPRVFLCQGGHPKETKKNV